MTLATAGIGQFDEKIAVVTGASRGIGRAVALLLAERGADVVLNARGRDGLESVAEQVRAFGRRVLVVPGDIGNEEDRTNLIEAAMTAFGRVDCLVSNASNVDVWYGHPPEAEMWDAFYRVDVLAAAHLTDLVAPSMCERRSGSIVFISSVSGKVVDGTAHGYAAAKAALIAAGKSLAIGLAPHNVRVNVVAPGSTWEPGNTWDAFKRERPDEARTIEAGIAMGRFGHPDEIAACVAFLLSEEARWVVGQCLVVDGGQYRGIA